MGVAYYSCICANTEVGGVRPNTNDWDPCAMRKCQCYLTSGVFRICSEQNYLNVINMWTICDFYIFFFLISRSFGQSVGSVWQGVQSTLARKMYIHKTHFFGCLEPIFFASVAICNFSLQFCNKMVEWAANALITILVHSYNCSFLCCNMIQSCMQIRNNEELTLME